jgi:hypothetical protein
MHKYIFNLHVFQKYVENSLKLRQISDSKPYAYFFDRKELLYRIWSISKSITLVVPRGSVSSVAKKNSLHVLSLKHSSRIYKRF